MTKLWARLANILPRQLVYWSSIRLIVNATVGKHSNQVVPDLTAIEALDRWNLEEN